MNEKDHPEQELVCLHLSRFRIHRVALLLQGKQPDHLTTLSMLNLPSVSNSAS